LRHFYSLLLYCLLPLVFLRLIILGFRTSSYWSRWNERLGFLPSVKIDQPVFWLHAVSVGEVEAATPIIERMLSQLPQYQIVITTVTPTGAETVQRRFKNNARHFYLPYDLPSAVQRFITQLQPSICVIMETELWPNLYHYCDQKNIPIMLVNARVSLHSLVGYKKFPGLLKKTFDCVTYVLAQSKLDAERIMMIGCDSKKVSVTGNLKFDVNLPSDIYTKAKSIRAEMFPNRPVWIAASTHEKEEEALLEAHEKILEQHQSCVLILAPRHTQRFNRVADLCDRSNMNVVRKSSNEKCTKETQVYLLDTLGELQTYYACADLAFVGGSLVPAGGHNMLEPACLGLPVLSGIHVSNFHEVSNLLLKAEALILVDDVSDLVDKVTQLLSNVELRNQMGENAKNLVAMHKGSADHVIDKMKSLLQ
jgi:3-deoxy-D-manno-octulosonic-acid transferase